MNLPSIDQLKQRVGRLVKRAVIKPAERYFQPTTQMRVRDVAREIVSPNTYRTVGKYTAQAARNVANSGNQISQGLAQTKYFQPTSQVRARDYVREVPGAISETAKGLAQGAARFGISAAEVPKTLRTGQATGRFYDTPVGRLNSFQSEAQNRVQRGDSLVKAIGNPALDTILAGSDLSILKPGLASLKNMSRVPQGVRNVASDLLGEVTKKGIRFQPPTRESIPQHYQKGGLLSVGHREDGDHLLPQLPEGMRFKGGIIQRGIDEVTGAPRLFINTEKLVPEQVVERGGFTPKSGLMEGLMRPGLTIKNVNEGEDAASAIERSIAEETLPKFDPKIGRMDAEPKVDDFPLLSGRTPIAGVNDTRKSQIKAADALLGREATLPDGSPMLSPEKPLALPEVKMTGLGDVEQSLLGNRSAEFDEAGKGMNFTLRKLQDFSDALISRGLQSESSIFRGIANGLRGFAGGLGKGQDVLSGISRLQGTQEYGLKLQSDLNENVFKGLLQGNVDSLRRIHRVLDPEAYVGQAAPQLAQNEQQAAGMLRLVSDFINDSNYQRGFISQENWLKNRGGKYIMRAYNWESELPEETQRFFEKNRFKMDIGGFMKRGELTDEMKSALSQDPIYLVGTRLREAISNAALHEFATSIKNNAELVSNTARNGFTQLSDHKAFGDLAGKFVRKDIVENINGLYFTNKFADAIYGVLRMYDNNPARRGLKKWLTVYNPAVRTGNNISELWFANNIGINPVSFGKQFLKERAKGTIAENDPLYLKMMKDGLVGSNVTSELVDATAQTRQDMLRMVDPTVAQKVLGAFQSADKAITGTYGRVDDYAKLAAMKILLRRGYNYPEAARQVARGFQNYRNVGWMWDVSSKLPMFGKTFGRFVGNMVQMEANAWVDRPIRKAATYGMIAAFADLMSAASGEEEQDRETREGRSWFPRVLGSNVPLSFQTPLGEVNASRWFPATSSSPFGADNMATDLGKVSPFVPPVTYKDGQMKYNPAAHTGDPLASPFLSLGLDQDFRGKSIQDPDQNPYVGSVLTPREKIENQLKFFGRSVSGGFLNTLKDIKSAAETGKDYYGRERSPMQAAANLIGLKVEKYGPEQAQNARDKSALYEVKGNERAEDKINAIQKAYRNGEITEEQAQARIQYQRSIQKSGGESGVSSKGFASAYGYEDILAPKGNTSSLQGALAETKRKTALTKLYLDDTVSDEMKQKIFSEGNVDMKALEKQVLKSESIAPEYRASLVYEKLRSGTAADMKEYIKDEILTYGMLDNMLQAGLIDEATRWKTRDFIKAYKTQLGLLKGSSGKKAPKRKAIKLKTDIPSMSKIQSPRATSEYRRAPKSVDFDAPSVTNRFKLK